MKTKVSVMFSVASQLHYKIQRCCQQGGGTDAINEMLDDLNTIYSLVKELGYADNFVCESYHKICMALYAYRGGSTKRLNDWVVGSFTGLMTWLCSHMGYKPCKNIINNPTTLFFVEDSTNTIVGTV